MSLGPVLESTSSQVESLIARLRARARLVLRPVDLGADVEPRDLRPQRDDEAIAEVLATVVPVALQAELVRVD